ncbi:hypothetical protein GCWU000321_00327 [Dialister invisus DSM 15470]|uniref:Uncharacterized protein n=1 Tax=Dialister invisus DSM 15470 TaxID=592028 RepID=C9LR60_9FIRM|nr:hypothetical protein GCWU000321_00327 [Dialister invisus DSM 15470]
MAFPIQILLLNPILYHDIKCISYIIISFFIDTVYKKMKTDACLTPVSRLF